MLGFFYVCTSWAAEYQLGSGLLQCLSDHLLFWVKFVKYRPDLLQNQQSCAVTSAHLVWWGGLWLPKLVQIPKFAQSVWPGYLRCRRKLEVLSLPSGFWWGLISVFSPKYTCWRGLQGKAVSKKGRQLGGYLPEPGGWIDLGFFSVKMSFLSKDQEPNQGGASERCVYVHAYVIVIRRNKWLGLPV